MAKTKGPELAEAYPDGRGARKPATGAPYEARNDHLGQPATPPSHRQESAGGRGQHKG